MYKPKAEESDDEEQSEEKKEDAPQRVPPSSPGRPTARVTPSSTGIPDQFPRTGPSISANKDQLNRRSRHSRGQQTRI